jgi:hypothetical protein
MSNRAITWAYARRDLKSGPKFVLVTLADMADQEDSCFPGIELLADLTGFGSTAIRGHIDALIAGGFITTERRHKKNGARTSDRYYLQLNPAESMPTEVENVAPESDGTSENLTPDSGSTSDEPNAGFRNDLTPDSGDPSAGFRPLVPYIAFNPQLTPRTEPQALTLIDAPEVPQLRLLEVPQRSTDDLFSTFWFAWPRKVERKAARKAFDKALTAVGGLPTIAAVEITDAAIAWATHWTTVEARTLDKIPHAATWLNGERWTDELPEHQPPPQRQTNAQAALTLARQLHEREQHHDDTIGNGSLPRLGR